MQACALMSRSESMNTVVAYLRTKARMSAESAMSTSDEVVLRRQQGTYTTLMAVAEMLEASRPETKRAKLSKV